jgi:hypothetical protein
VVDRRAALELLALGNGEPLTHNQLRRAYLRRLRDYPPERDPEGFRRLREAFEMLEPMVRVHEWLAAHAPVSEPSTSTSDAASADQPVGAGAEASAPHPLPDAPGTPVQLAAATEAPLPDAPPSSGSLPTAQDSEPAPAPAWHEDPEPEMTLEALNDQILDLFERGETEEALALAHRWGDQGLDDHRRISTYVARRWALTRELLNVAVALPDSILRALAHGIATNDVASACPEIQRYQVLRPDRTRDLARHLYKRARNLHTLVASALLPPEQAHGARGQDRARRSSRGNRGFAWPVMVVALAFIRLLGHCDSSPSPALYEHLQDEPQFRLDPVAPGSLPPGSLPPGSTSPSLLPPDRLELKPLWPGGPRPVPLLPAPARPDSLPPRQPPPDLR